MRFTLNPPDITTVVFDWGNTLMRVDPRFSGPMMLWDEVSTMPGAEEVLFSLQKKFRLVVGTNAADSNAYQVGKALERVNIKKPFHAIFTARELGARKPDLKFFRQMESVLGMRPEQMVMVGDKFSEDVLGAKRAGWRAIWYNPDGESAPGLLPLQDGDIQHLSYLPDSLFSLDLPDVALCQSWMAEFGLPVSLQMHVQMVAAISYQLAVWLRKAGQKVNPLLVHRSGLLHDLAKMQTLGKEIPSSMGHAELGARLMEDRGYPQIARVIRTHALHSLNELETWEQKLVYFADKLVEGSRLVALEERINAFKQRYPHEAERIALFESGLSRLQDEILSHLGIDNEEESLSMLKASLTSKPA